MTFPWKKVKKTSISKLVKDHYYVNSQSGSSPLMMVETGFPTSLVDLVVKNHSRFKKPSPKKKKSPPLMVDNSPPPSPPPPPCSPDLRVVDDVVVRPLIRESESQGEKDYTCEKVNNKVKKNCPVEEGWGNGGVSMNQGLVAVLKMVMVVVLVLGMNNLVIGITVSAFLLFFLEYLGERLYGGLLKPSFRIWEIIRGKVVKLDDEDDEYPFKALSQPQEIDVVKESEFFKEKIEECICDGKLECEGVEVENGVVMEKGEEFGCEISESKVKKSRRAKMKSKMKKLVPTRFRKEKSSKLECHTILNAVDNVIEERKELELKSDGTMSLVASRIDDTKNDSIDDTGSVTSVGESSRGLTTDGNVELESIEGIDKATSTIEHNSIYIVLLLAVLVGLIGGRILALVFTLTCCLMLKRGEGIRRYTKLPVIRSFAKMFV